MSARPDTPGPAELAAVALALAERGWPVFPLRPGSKRPALHGETRCPRTGPCAGGHRGWEQRATTDPDRIRRAWTAGPFNIGIPTGRAGLLVIDLDTPDPHDPDDQAPPEHAGATGGADVLAALAERAGQPVPATYTVATPSAGGRHLYFLAPTGPGAPLLRNTAGERGRGLGWKVDTRGHGGYVVGGAAAGALALRAGGRASGLDRARGQRGRAGDGVRAGRARAREPAHQAAAPARAAPAAVGVGPHRRGPGVALRARGDHG